MPRPPSDGSKAEARQILDDFRRSHPDYDASRIVRMFDVPDPDFIEGRARLIANLKEIGLP